MSVGKMTLHRFNGDEIYSVESATIEHMKDEDGSYLVTFRAETGDTPIQTLPDYRATESTGVRRVDVNASEDSRPGSSRWQQFHRPEGLQ
jgi:hypothetical protein